MVFYKKKSIITLVFLLLFTWFQPQIHGSHTDESQPSKKISLKKRFLHVLKKTQEASKKTGSLAMGTVFSLGCIGSTIGVFALCKTVYKAKKYYSNWLIFKATKYCLKYFSDVPDMEKYLIPAGIFTLSTASISCLYAAIKMFAKVRARPSANSSIIEEST